MSKSKQMESMDKYKIIKKLFKVCNFSPREEAFIKEAFSQEIQLAVDGEYQRGYKAGFKDKAYEIFNNSLENDSFQVGNESK